MSLHRQIGGPLARHPGGYSFPTEHRIGNGIGEYLPVTIASSSETPPLGLTQVFETKKNGPSRSKGYSGCHLGLCSGEGGFRASQPKPSSAE